MIEQDDMKRGFAERLNIAMDQAGFDSRGRATTLANIFDVTTKGASKWLNGESIPEVTRVIIIAKFFDKSIQWLLTGDDTTVNTTNNPRTTQLIGLINKMDKEQKLTDDCIDFLLSALIFVNKI